jgi:hypothetical protein
MRLHSAYLDGTAINSKEDVKDWTKSDYRMVTKRFYRWLRNQEFVKDIKACGAEETVGPEDILDEKELSSLFSCCTNLRDKALQNKASKTAIQTIHPNCWPCAGWYFISRKSFYSS